MDQKGQQIKVLINTRDQKTAHHAAAAALLELGARAHFCIDQARAMWLLTETDQRFTHNPPSRATTARPSFNHKRTTMKRIPLKIAARCAAPFNQTKGAIT